MLTNAEYPTLRSFTLMPGIIETELTAPQFMPFAKDSIELPGAMALYLVQERADFLRGATLLINWDVTELEAKKREIVDGGLLKTSWLPILPLAGGKGLP